jgi:hypothetical protein
MRDVFNYCNSRSRQLIIGCSANAHHILLGSTDINPTGGSLMVSLNLGLLNRGNITASVISSRKEVTDVTLGTDHIGKLVKDSHVSDKTCLSDHRYIFLQVRMYSFMTPTELIGDQQ